jgi:phosphomevalonate kinase
VRAIAPGKLVLTGAYAVLEGAPAIVVAVDRYAVADASRRARASAPEVDIAFEGGPAPAIDVRAQQDAHGRKLGIGSSAAALVAALAADALARGEDVATAEVRARIFAAARAAHARAQSGGSGVDVAASVYGGLVRYAIAGDTATVRPLPVPPDLVIVAFASGVAVRTSDLRARVEAARAMAPRDFERHFEAMHRVAAAAAESLAAGDSRAFIVSARTYGELLDELGRLADAPIVTPEARELAALVAATSSASSPATRSSGVAAFLPSGAGGGDVAVWIGTSAPPAPFRERAEALSHTPLVLSIDRGGVRAAPPECV